MNGLKKLSANARILWHSLFYGMKAADVAMQSQASGEEGGTEINQKVKPTGAFADMLEQKVTKEVEELRDSYCKIVADAKYSFWDDKCKLLTIYAKIANCIEELKKYKEYISNRTYVEYCIKNLIR